MGVIHWELIDTMWLFVIIARGAVTHQDSNIVFGKYLSYLWPNNKKPAETLP